MEIGLAAAFLGGLVTLLSPCSALLLPSFFAYAFSSRTQLLARTAVFFLGLLTMLLPIGIFASTLGALITGHRGLIVTIAGGLVILAGVLSLAGVRMRLPQVQHGGGSGALSVYILGIAFGVAGSCSGPVLGSILTIAALRGDALFGGALLTVYALGMVVPLFLLALAWEAFDIGSRGWLRPRVVRIGRWRSTWIEVVSALLMIGVGVLLIATDGTAGLGGILTIQQQFDLELWASGPGAAWVPMLLLGLAIFVGLMVALRLRRRRELTAAPLHASQTADTGE
ncbi:cytochrome c biogenesis CcdA family protein [Microterricola pindariensis]|uniref:Cytochrome C biogenesis protein CcdA n=1 Tax=Microterricola pindariensis TaxID=478010 RepID=A0ABX5AWH5_9MICO|nr:cytochrome c biogenesis CcdA family protein [Microterricola pindariensis]PPL19016.1 cytochrome C biogenesis protein CcdA [Microterricola pindariensis]